MGEAIIITVIRLREVAIGLCPSISMCPDVSKSPGETIPKGINADDGFSRPSNIRGADVRHFPAPKEDAAYKDHTAMVQKVGFANFREK